jgi:GAF domain-containing protein
VDATDRTARLEVMLAVSRHVAESGDLRETLDLIAREAVQAARAGAASILLIGAGPRLRLGGSWGLSERVRTRFEDPRSGLGLGAGPTGLALRSREQVAVPDIEQAPWLAEWYARTAGGGNRSVATTPLFVEGDLVGALNVFRRKPGPWLAEELELLSFLADHAATALRVADLIARQNRQLAGFDRVLRGLREQTHEHANRIHSVAALIAMGEEEEARRFISEQIEAHGRSHEAVVDRIEPPALAGLLLAEITVARQSGIELRVDRRSRLTELPAGLSEAESVELVGHLLQYALESLVDVPPHRRRAIFRASSGPRHTAFEVRDWGNRPASMDAEKPQTGPAALLDGRLPTLTKSLLLESIAGAGGVLDIAARSTGSKTTVTIPRP